MFVLGVVEFIMAMFIFGGYYYQEFMDMGFAVIVGTIGTLTISVIYPSVVLCGMPSNQPVIEQDIHFELPEISRKKQDSNEEQVDASTPEA
jgi:hypothetical protein